MSCGNTLRLAIAACAVVLLVNAGWPAVAAAVAADCAVQQQAAGCSPLDAAEVCKVCVDTCNRDCSSTASIVCEPECVTRQPVCLRCDVRAVNGKILTTAVVACRDDCMSASSIDECEGACSFFGALLKSPSTPPGGCVRCPQVLADPVACKACKSRWIEDCNAQQAQCVTNACVVGAGCPSSVLAL